MAPDFSLAPKAAQKPISTFLVKYKNDAYETFIMQS